LEINKNKIKFLTENLFILLFIIFLVFILFFLMLKYNKYKYTLKVVAYNIIYTHCTNIYADYT